MNDQLKTFLAGLLDTLVDLRKFGSDGGHRISYAIGQITAAERLGVLTYEQGNRFLGLVYNACQHVSSPFPCEENFGPCMPIQVWWSRHKTALEVKARLAKLPVRSAESFEDEAEYMEPCPTCEGNGEVDGWPCVECSGLRRVPVDVKPQAQDSANEKPEPVPAPSPRPELRLLCVLAKPHLDTAQGAYLPIHTMHRLPPRAMVKGQWSEPRYSGLHLRETQARQPSAEVLERCLPKRHLRTNGRLSVLGGTV